MTTDNVESLADFFKFEDRGELCLYIPKSKDHKIDFTKYPDITYTNKEKGSFIASEKYRTMFEETHLIYKDQDDSFIGLA